MALALLEPVLNSITLGLLMFSIRVLPATESDVDSQRLGEISIGEFTERFACYPVGASVDELDRLWRVELRKLVEGVTAVALTHDPRFAWVIYREGKNCFIQQVFSPDGDFFGHLASRITVTENGHRVSEWNTDVSAIAQFLGA
jgi:hypothetical protein